MERYLPLLYGDFIIPQIEDAEIIERASKLYQDLTPAQGRLCEEIQELYVNKAFLLGVRTGAKLEQFLNQELT